jgi:FtsP/CotA-like multicopper oxidase with cupredoxin domain
MASSRAGRLRLVVACVATAVILGPLLWFWRASLLPDTYDATRMGYPDTGGGAVHGGHGRGKDVSTFLADPSRPADVSITLTARRGSVRLASGRLLDGYTLNGTSPGPTIRAVVGQLVEVTLVNESVPDGVTLHWHGVDVPNAQDGVAGVTQDAVRVGRSHVYRFVAEDAGTYWYHSHQVSHDQVAGGLLGALVITPASTVDGLVALAHTYGGFRTVNGTEGDFAVPAAPGDVVRVRIVNTDNGPVPVWVAGAQYRLVAIDGTDVRGPTDVSNRYVLVTAGGRADLSVTMPAGGSAARVHIGGPTGVLLGSGPIDPIARPSSALDPLAYGTPAALPFDPAAADRVFRYDIGRRPGFLDGRPGMWWTVNGHTYPDLPMFMVAAGDVVRMRISNHSGQVHPMHLHGHHMVVLSRDGVPASGSPWWTDSLNVADGDAYDVAFVADNPGVWMDHCHNLKHAAEGLVVHLMYEGVSTSYTIGGAAGNEPE